MFKVTQLLLSKSGDQNSNILIRNDTFFHLGCNTHFLEPHLPHSDAHAHAHQSFLHAGLCPRCHSVPLRFCPGSSRTWQPSHLCCPSSVTHLQGLSSGHLLCHLPLDTSASLPSWNTPQPVTQPCPLRQSCFISFSQQGQTSGGFLSGPPNRPHPSAAHGEQPTTACSSEIREKSSPGFVDFHALRQPPQWTCASVSTQTMGMDSAKGQLYSTL